MNWFGQAAQKLGLRARAYKATFPEGSFQQAVLLDLATYAHAFDEPDGLADEQMRVLRGRRQMFWRVWQNLKLTQADLEIVARNAIVRAAERLSRTQGAQDE